MRVCRADPRAVELWRILWSALPTIGHFYVAEAEDIDSTGSASSLLLLQVWGHDRACVGEHGTCREIATKSAEAISVSRA